MAIPVFQHGKNAFLALGYDLAATLATGTSASAVLTITSITSAITSEAPTLTGGSKYGLFVGGVPVISNAAPASSPVTLTATPSTAFTAATVLPMYNISPYINDISFPQAIETPETTTFSKEAVKTYIVGLKGYNISFGGHYDGSTAGIDAIMTDLIKFQDAGNFIPFVYGPSSPGAFTGQTADMKYYGQGLLTKYDLKSPVGGVVEFNGEIQVSGAVVRSTI
jgi:hypothetical protein